MIRQRVINKYSNILCLRFTKKECLKFYLLCFKKASWFEKYETNVSKKCKKIGKIFQEAFKRMKLSETQDLSIWPKSVEVLYDDLSP